MKQIHAIALSEAHQEANGQILISNVYFSKNMREQNFASSSALPSESSVSEQCGESQLAEGTCFEKAIATLSFETAAVEEIAYMPSAQNYSQGANAPDPWLFITLCLLGMVSISSVSVVSIVALFFGRDISLSALLKPLGFLKFKAKNKNKVEAKAKNAKDKDTKDK